MNETEPAKDGCGRNAVTATSPVQQTCIILM